MKKILVSVLFIFLAFHAYTTQVSYEDASRTAAMKLQVSEQSEHSILDVHEMNSEQGALLAYVFDLSPIGFIITSTDTYITPILAYSFRNNFSMEKSNFNQGYVFIETNMTLQREALDFISNEVKQENNETWNKYLSGDESYFLTRDVTWPPDEYGSITGGWIEEEWNQNPNPYYTFCPMDPSGSRCVVGCVATAMAQIMYFHRYIGNPVFNDSDDYWSTYTSPVIHLDNDHDLWDFPTFSELNIHLADLANAFATNGEITNDMIAAINFGAGVSVEMGYSSQGSGAYPSDVNYALIYKFDYDSATFTSNINGTFYTNLQNNMVDAKPVFFGISGTDVGHAIICDGWNETDNTYHLNMGWGGFDNGWYTLPYGMPAGYNTISSAVINIDGGEPFIEVFGQVVAAPGIDLTQAIVTLNGPRNYEIQVSDTDGYFNIPWVKGGIYQATATIELDSGGYYYKTFEIELNESSSSIAFILDNYETIDGTVSAAISTENASIAIYDGSQIVRTGLADVSGNYTVSGLLPGDYYATASLNGNFFDEQPITITASTQTFNFNCLEFEYDHIISFHGDPTDQYQLLPEMGVGIMISGNNLIGHDNDSFAKLAFIAPFNPEQGSITAQIWDGITLVTEKEVTYFSEGNWKTVIFDNFVPIDADKEYYAGYVVSSNGGLLPATYRDNGPNVEGGAYIKIGGNWTPLNATTFDFNFCIQGIAISTNPSGIDENMVTISTNILNENYPNPFNPSTTISYNLAEDSDVELTIYNLKGQRVKQLISIDQLLAGQHSVEWNGTDDTGKNVSSGIYLYKLKAGDKYTSTKKMILLK